jgi:excisionase family DNA binding protein
MAVSGSSRSLTQRAHFHAQKSMSTIPTPIPTHPRLTREDVLDGRDVAELLHLPISTVLEYARRGVLPGRKLGRRWIFLRDEVEEAVRQAPIGASSDRWATRV